MCLRPGFCFWLEERSQGMTACFERARHGDPAAVEAVLAPLRPRMERMAAFYARCSGEEVPPPIRGAGSF